MLNFSYPFDMWMYSTIANVIRCGWWLLIHFAWTLLLGNYFIKSCIQLIFNVCFCLSFKKNIYWKISAIVWRLFSLFSVLFFFFVSNLQLLLRSNVSKRKKETFHLIYRSTTTTIFFFFFGFSFRLFVLVNTNTNIVQQQN